MSVLTSRNRRLLAALGGGLSSLFVAGGATSLHADPVADFYRGRTLSLVSGFTPNGEYDSQLRLLGMIPYADLTALMQASVALLNPSLFEGWSTPVEEARALGVPLVLSDLAVHREQAGNDAMYFERHSAAALADALQGFQPIPDADRAQMTADTRGAAASRVLRFAADFADLVVASATAHAHTRAAA